MRRDLATAMFVFAFACALDGPVSAQSTESKTKVKAEHGKTVTYTGCVQTGTESRTYILQNVVPISTTETTGTSGTTTTTTYALVPEGKVEFREHVGHKVEVTGVLVPAGKGETKYKAETKGERSEQETKGEVKRGAVPQLRVISVKPIGQSCSS